MAGNASQPGITVIARAVAILTAFDEQHRALTLSELARRADLSLTTTHRMTKEMTSHGVLTRNEAGQYVVGHRIWSLGLLAPVQSDLREVAAPFLNDLYAATLATVHLAVRDRMEVLYLDRLSGNRSVPVVSTVGSRLPLHATGVGKVLLAYAPDEVRQHVLSNLRRITPYTITQPTRLQSQLQRVRTDGYATTVEEMSLGACSVAVPIRSDSGDVTAALGMVIPDLKRERSRLVAALQVAAHGIGRSLPLRGT